MADGNFQQQVVKYSLAIYRELQQVELCVRMNHTHDVASTEIEAEYTSPYIHVCGTWFREVYMSPGAACRKFGRVLAPGQMVIGAIRE